MPKNALFLLKNCKNRRALEANFPHPRISPHDKILATNLIVYTICRIDSLL